MIHQNDQLNSDQLKDQLIEQDTSSEQEETIQEKTLYFISSDLRPFLIEGTECLLLLKAEIEQKRGYLIDLSNGVFEKAQALLPTTNISLNKEDLDQSYNSITEYLYLLERIHQEIVYEIDYFSRLVHDTQEKREEELPAGILHKIKGVKKYTKQIRKDLLISFSRYQFGFNAQAKRLAFIERLVVTSQRKTE